MFQWVHHIMEYWIKWLLIYLFLFSYSPVISPIKYLLLTTITFFLYLRFLLYLLKALMLFEAQDLILSWIRFQFFTSKAYKRNEEEWNVLIYFHFIPKASTDIFRTDEGCRKHFKYTPFKLIIPYDWPWACFVYRSPNIHNN